MSSAAGPEGNVEASTRASELKRDNGFQSRYDDSDTRPAKRNRVDDTLENNPAVAPEEYTVGWVCALPLEMAAAKGMLDQVHPNLSQ
ncbi:hypothetical protein ACHAPA_003103 [Fusarium lateritium]